MNKTLDIVLQELKHRLNNNNLSPNDTIQLDIVKDLLREDNLYLLDEYVDRVQTPFGLAWYYENWNIQHKYIPLIDLDLTQLLDKNLVSFSIYNDFTYRIRIDKKTNIDEGKQSLIIKANISEEDGTPEINYKIIGPEGWGWNITKQQLMALIESKIIFKENIDFNNKPSSIWKKLINLLKKGK